MYFDICWLINFNGKKPNGKFCNRDKTARFFLKNCLKFMIFSKLPCSSATTLPRFLQLWYQGQKQRGSVLEDRLYGRLLVPGWAAGRDFAITLVYYCHGMYYQQIDRQKSLLNKTQGSSNNHNLTKEPIDIHHFTSPYILN